MTTDRTTGDLTVLFGAAVVPILLAACDLGTSLSGRVTTHAGTPVGDAVVQTVCTNRSGAMRAASDANGRFSARGLGCIHKTCRLEVILPGEPAEVLSVATYCTHTAFGCGRSCSDLVVNFVARK